MLAATGVTQFGAGMLADPAGQAAAAAWAANVSLRIDAWYIAFDMDALDASGNWAIAMPESDGLTLDAAAVAVRAIATSGAPVAGFGATAIMDREGADLSGTMEAVAVLAEAALAPAEPGPPGAGVT